MDEGRKEPERLLIGDLVLDVGLRRVSRRGVALDLPKLSFRLLHALALAAPNVLTQDELIAQVWPGRVISPETLTQRVKLVRQALGDDANAPRYIGLARGEGYRMLAAVEPLRESPSRPAWRLLEAIVHRNVLGIALVYVAGAWALARGLGALVEALPLLPRWIEAVAASVLVVGFPAALAVAWRFATASSRHPFRWSASGEARLAAAGALLALVGATTALAYLIYPSADGNGNRVAVMPFENRGGDAADDYMSEGIATQLRNQLSAIGALDVVARASSVLFRDRELDPKIIAERLAVGRLVDGTFERQGDLIRVTIEIIDGETGVQLWTQLYETEADRLLATQRQISDDVMNELLPGAGSPVPAGLPTDSESAYSLFMRADHYYQQVLGSRTVDEPLLQAAIDLYRHAVDEDPTSALLQSRLGAALLYAGRVSEAERPIVRAQELDETLADVQHTLGLYLYARGEDGVGAHFARSAERNPNNTEALVDYGHYLLTRGDPAGAREQLERALKTDPMAVARYADLAEVYAVAAEYGRALEVADEVERRFADASGYLAIARIRELTGDLDEAIGWALKAREHEPELPDAGWYLGELYTRIGDLETAKRYDSEPSVNKFFFSGDYEALIDLASTRMLEDEDTSPLALFVLARALVATDRDRQAAALLEGHGIPQRLRRDSHSTNDIEAGVVLADAWKQTGRVEEAETLARRLMVYFRKYAIGGDAPPWQPYFFLACLYSVVDEDQAALDALERAAASRGMLWYPVVKDQPCFRKKFAGNARYEAVLHVLVARKQRLRDKLPGTLERFGVPQSEFRSTLAARTTTTE